MGKRIHPRMQIAVPVRIFGTDRNGQIFSEKVNTVTISRSGVELADIQAELKLDDAIGMSYASNRANFRVKWVGSPGTAKAGHAGLQNMAPEKALWDFPLPDGALDNYQPGTLEQRKNPRFRCQNSIEVHVQGGASFWGTASDLSLEGCYVEMPLPLAPGTKLTLGLWLGQNKIAAEALVIHRTPGLGVGIRFTQITEQDVDGIRRFLQTLSPFAKKAVRQPQTM
jgi:PilZ domain